MSETPQGPGWWQASDAKWYPPEARPSPSAAPPPPLGYPYPSFAPQRSEGLAVASLIVGIAGFLVCPLVGPILALVFGYRAKGRIRESGGTLGGDGLATAGIVLGYVGLVIPVIAILAIVAITLVGTNASTKFSTISGNLSLIVPSVLPNSSTQLLVT